jgi:hypothetical protein
MTDLLLTDPLLTLHAVILFTGWPCDRLLWESVQVQTRKKNLRLGGAWDEAFRNLVRN